jgi:hypothetical protein
MELQRPWIGIASWWFEPLARLDAVFPQTDQRNYSLRIETSSFVDSFQELLVHPISGQSAHPSLHSLHNWSYLLSTSACAFVVPFASLMGSKATILLLHASFVPICNHSL